MNIEDKLPVKQVDNLIYKNMMFTYQKKNMMFNA